MEIGESLKLKGYITQLHLVSKKTGAQLEKMMTYKAMRRGYGWALLHLKELPGPLDFRLMGEPGGKAPIDTALLQNPLDQRTAKMRMDTWDTEYPALREHVINDTFVIAGAKRLVKVLPNRLLTGNRDYPPAGKMVQWHLTKKLKFKVVALIPPEGGRWQKMGAEEGT